MRAALREPLVDPAYVEPSPVSYVKETATQVREVAREVPGMQERPKITFEEKPYDPRWTVVQDYAAGNTRVVSDVVTDPRTAAAHMKVMSKLIQDYVQSADYGESSTVRHQVHRSVTSILKSLQQGQKILHSNLKTAYETKVAALFHFATERLHEAQLNLAKPLQGPDEERSLYAVAEQLHTRGQNVLDKGIVVEESLETTVEAEGLVYRERRVPSAKKY
ncbi:MAG: hypothetical protein QF486_05875 [Candidatus Woesearchaeota archaeon]|nr:hypothetical protein [Candidatus Woesearchaeota archaeon]MDP7182027.1 hypothetical protein [Candidatus Woesearchaeota archaeon]MDP7199114.1 hypothetical protein [Candidatus Woesearchaeota archaeon]MDP7467881.1 hypothetical protein [Candidatus Woesearchaeota archaeon]MDP7646520.1 hypothetical protein [Candidatus Woesearchaeota archaeon]